jgi:hypothetical protein
MTFLFYLLAFLFNTGIELRPMIYSYFIVALRLLQIAIGTG